MQWLLESNAESSWSSERLVHRLAGSRFDAVYFDIPASSAICNE